MQTTWEKDRKLVWAAVNLIAMKFKYLTRSLFLKSLQFSIQLLTTVINAEWVSGWLVGTSLIVYFPTQSPYAQEFTSSRKSEGPVSGHRCDLLNAPLEDSADWNWSPTSKKGSADTGTLHIPLLLTAWETWSRETPCLDPVYPSCIFLHQRKF